MAEKIVSEASEFDDIDLEDDFADKPKEVVESLDLGQVSDQDAKPEENPPLDLDDLNLDDDSPSQPPVVKEETPSLDTLNLEEETSTPEAKDDLVPEKQADPLDLEIDLDLEVTSDQKPVKIEIKAETPPAETKPVEEAKKRGRKPKETPAESLVKNTDIMTDTSSIIFNPTFELSCLSQEDFEKYQQRKTDRGKDAIEELASKIKTQGLVDPLQILLDADGKFYIMAGFGRYQALKSLGITQAKALVYVKLPPDEIEKICNGSNEGRVDLSDWDKVYSVGKYYEKNDLVSKDDKDDPKSLVSIFGYSASSIYSYLTYYKFYKDKIEFEELFKKHRVPLFVISLVQKIFNEYEKMNLPQDKVAEIVERIVLKNEVSKKSFEFVFNQEIADLIVSIKTNSETKVNLDGLEKKLEDESLKEAELKVELDIENATKDAGKVEIPASDVKKLMDECLDAMISSSDSLLTLINKIQAGEDYKKYLDQTKLAALIKKVQAFNTQLPKLI